MTFSDSDKKFLSHLGRTEDGTILLAVLSKMKAYYSTIDDIDTSRDTAAQVEGRKLMKALITELQEAMQSQPRVSRPRQVDDYT